MQHTDLAHLPFVMQDPTEVLDEYGADALRLYLINSPVVRGETLRFKKEGVFAVVKDVFLPWYNAYRFLVQNVLRLQQQTGIAFEPTKVWLHAMFAEHPNVHAVIQEACNNRLAFEPTKVWLQVMPSEHAEMHVHAGASMQVCVAKCDAVHQRARSLGVLKLDAVQGIVSACLCCQLSSFRAIVCILFHSGQTPQALCTPCPFQPRLFPGTRLKHSFPLHAPCTCKVCPSIPLNVCNLTVAFSMLSS